MATSTITAPTGPTQPYVLNEGDGVKHHFLNNLATTKVTAGPDGSMTAVEFLAPRGFGPPLHAHHHEDELIVVLDGEIAFRCGDDEHIATTGGIAFLPHAIPHTFQVRSSSARMLSVTSSASGTPIFDQMVAALGDPTDDTAMPAPTEIDGGRVALVCADHQIDVLGPPPAPLGDEVAE